MKKKSLLIMLLVALFAPLAMNGQTRTELTVADQTGTSSYVPFYGLYVDDYQHNQTIYPSTMLTEMQGGQITKLTYYLNRSVSKDFGATIEIRLGTTTSTAFSSGTVNYISISGNPVYTDTDLSVSGTTVEFDFSDNPYTYTSGNLVVDVRITSTGGWSSTTWLGESASTCYSAYAYSGSMPTQGNGLTFMPKTTFTYTVSSTPQIVLNPSAATILTGSTETLTATTLNVTGTPTITFTSSNTSVATVSGSGTSATVTAVSAGTATITATMTYNGNTYTAQCPITVEDPSYCTPSGYGSNDDCIVRFVLGDIDNQTASSSTNGYGDYTNLSTSLEQGETATATVYGGAGSGNHAAAIWIDFNNNYEFETSERVGTTSSYITANGNGTITFTIPSDAPAGSHRLRVKYEYGTSIDPTNIDPCTSSTQYGEAEDYTIVINTLGAYTITCTTTTGGTISADKNNADENVVVTITATPDANYQLTALTYTPEGGSAQNIDITSTPYTFTMPAANVTVNATFTLPGNLPPYALTVGTPLGHSVVLGWTGASTNTNHQSYELYFSTDPVMPQTPVQSSFIGNITATSRELTGLTPETTYYAWVRDNCGTDGYSEWVAFNAFTTDVACPAPSNLSVSNLTAHGATINWSGEAESYDILYHTATITGTTENPIFTYGFEDNLVGWTTFALGYSSDLTDWSQYDATNLGSDYNNTNHGGSYVGRSKSYAGSSGGDVTVDNWLISPQITIGDKMTFWVSDDGTWHEHLEIRVCTAASFSQSTLTSDFALVEATAATGKPWEMKTIDLSAYAGQQGYIAIRNNDTGKDFVCLDDITVYETIYTYDYGTDQFASSNTNSCPISGLSPETLYEVQVMGNCGDEGTSAWSNSFMFTTPDNCGAPQELAASNVTATTATLSWADDKDSYNLKYRKVYFYEGFESETLPTGWTTIDANGDGNTWGIGFATSHGGNNGAYNLSYIYNSTGTTPDDYLVSPLLDLQGTLRVWLSGYGDRYEENFAIYVSTNGNSASDFTTTLVGETTTTNSYVEYTADLSSYEGQQGYIAIRHFNCSDQYYLYVDDFGLYGTEDWVTLSPNPTTETANLTNLAPLTGYEWQVQGVNCDGNGSATEWSTVATFTTLEIPAVPVESITVNPDEIYPTVGATYSIVFTVLPADATNPAVTFSSDDATVATVDENGTVTAVAAGTATITIAATDGSGVTGTFTVTVTNIDVEEITAQDITTITGETATINYQVLPEQATDKSVTFTSANTAIATVDENGVVTGVAVGETTITIASVQNPEVTTDINVTVTSNPYAAQFTLNIDKTKVKAGDVITVEAYLNAPESGEYNGFTGLVLGLHFDPTAFAVNGDPVKGPVANACTMAMTALPNETHPDLVQCSCVMPVGTPNTTTGLVFTAQFTVLTEVELGSYTFYAEPTSASNFVYAPDTNNPSNKTPIPYEYVPSTVEVGNYFTKVIDGYGNADNPGGWYLIASPVADEFTPTEDNGFITNVFDLYRFNQSADNLEWENWKSQANGNDHYHFNIEPGKGYLYANNVGTTLTFTGDPISGTEKTVNLVYEGGHELSGWNLVGNPFADTAYVGDHPFYVMKNDGSEVIAASDIERSYIEPMEGIFVVAGEDGETLTFTTEKPSKGSAVTLNLSNDCGVVDRAIVRFDESRQLPKFMINESNTKMYITKEGSDYAVVRSDRSNRLPVNFEPSEDGMYVISTKVENVAVSTLYLVDHLRGIKVDLLNEPEYEFVAKVTDKPNRFELVYKTGTSSFFQQIISRNDEGEEFGFISDGNLIINNEGKSVLQVIDVTGRILSSETINGSYNKQIDAAPGVYLLRLVNGDDVKTQKIVIE